MTLPISLFHCCPHDFKPVNWALYDDSTPAIIIRFLEEQRWLLDNLDSNPAAYNDVYRWTLHYGDTLTGRSWKMADSGYIGRVVTPEIQRWAIFNTKKTKRGKGIMTARIIKIEPASQKVNQGRPIYRHPNFYIPTEAEYKQDQDIVRQESRKHRRILIRS